MITYRQPFKGDYPITLDYGEEYLPIYKKGEHKGIDYGCPTGTPILASAAGTVLKRGYEPNGYGYFMILIHEDNSGTVYAHLSRFKKAVQEHVKKGDVIAESGSSGKSTGPHLHFEIRTLATDLNSAIDPKTKLQSVWDANAVSLNESVSASHPELSAGWVKIVCDLANVRCHCDPDRIIDQRKKDTAILIGEDVTIFHGLPYRSFYDNETGCRLLIAEYDGYGTQILEKIN